MKVVIADIENVNDPTCPLLAVTFRFYKSPCLLNTGRGIKTYAEITDVVTCKDAWNLNFYKATMIELLASFLLMFM